MDYVQQPNPKVHNQFLSLNFKGTIKLMLSFSLFCVLFSLLPLLLSFKPFLMQFFTIGKGYMFLLCNGLLVFIAKYSGLINISSPSAHQSEVAVDNEKSSRLEFKVSEIAAPIAAENDMETESQQAEEKSLMIVGQENGLSDTQEEGGEEEGNVLMIIDEDEHAAEDTEELNKKCEDFIRKMKAAFYSEPRDYYSSDFDNQKTLVAVN